MQSFEHDEVTRFADVRRKVGRRDVLIAGGTDLVPLMRDGLVTPRTVVDLKTVRGGAGIRASRSGGAVGALALVADVAAHAGIRRWCPAGDCLRRRGHHADPQHGDPRWEPQRIRCWYFRRRVPCHKTGNRGCPAVDGLNEYLSVFGDGPCHAPHPSDPAVALAALESRVHVRLGRSSPGIIRLSVGWRARRRWQWRRPRRCPRTSTRSSLPGTSCGRR